MDDKGDGKMSGIIRETLRSNQGPTSRRHWLSACLGLGLLCLSGCQTSPAPPSAALPASRVHASETATENAVRYEILADRSDVRFLVFREGPLAKLGHNHVIQAKTIRGEILVAPDIHQSRFFIEIPVKDFHVDAAELRRDEGGDFLPQPDDDAIAGTTRNMLGEKVLDVANYPMIEIESVALNGPDWGLDVTMRIRLHGVEREIVVPAAVAHDRDTLVVTAVFSIRQSDFAIVPMRVFGGALQVGDTVKVRMRIVAGKG